mmetsp:Transcript_10376/g.22868  ORF Transcript_10376/g.22868 Transcript_10376/m.22868 type:complete len:259 (+) Transcript_10376:154-930(+)|eukprot:CAMPEP_0206472560 /NCGR_PEP_ID=MMETSP0324_2-20121206/32279_1 /ASSEMBLY_ACC=CAM_ASM_000836 /TAXON_ID=2866 /ORGANISM="Crypthecodinium cohnii, Strain Seligo" /LENGTH=258 /DNA_ID=CAMNT_0053947195 /DNA_START=132 /DNA_END=911 /DNA_ORIENTATION=+
MTSSNPSALTGDSLAGKEAAAVDDEGPAPHFKYDFEELEGGIFIWHASLVLLRYLRNKERRKKIAGSRILELGSGLGHLGHAMARMGAEVICTDQKKCLGDLQKSLAHQDTLYGKPEDSGGSIRTVELDWGEEGWSQCELSKEEQAPFDFIISAELVYLEETHDLLLWTMQKLCSPQTIIYSVFINRPFSWNFFAKLDDMKVFEVEQLDEDKDFDACGLEECHMHKIYLLPPKEKEKETEAEAEAPPKEAAEKAEEAS